MLIIAIDPGIAGALAFLPDGAPAVVHDMPVVAGRVDAHALHALVRLDTKDIPAHCFLEQSQSMPSQGVTSTFHYGISYGILLGILAALEIPYTEVRPGKWKRALGLGKEKEDARLRAMQLFPHCDLHLKKYHGRAEALLLGWYGLRQLPGLPA